MEIYGDITIKIADMEATQGLGIWDVIYGDIKVLSTKRIEEFDYVKIIGE